MTVASERQIAANRRNSIKSTGPRSKTGKKRAARNATRHGLTISAGLVQGREALDLVARQIAGDSTDEFILERASTAARAQLELAHIRRVKIAMMNRVYAFGSHELRPRFVTLKDVKVFLGLDVCSEKPAPLPTITSQGSDRAAEAALRLGPELCRLDRYESRAFRTRNRALREISLRLKLVHNV